MTYQEAKESMRRMAEGLLGVAKHRRRRVIEMNEDGYGVRAISERLGMNEDWVLNILFGDEVTARGRRKK